MKHLLWVAPISAVVISLGAGLRVAAEPPATATQLLAERGVDTSNQGLMKAAESYPDKRLRMLAAAELGTRQVYEAKPLLAKLFDTEEEESSRVLLADALARLGDPRGPAYLKRTCDESSDPAIRYDAAVRLLGLGSDYGFKTMVDLARSGGPLGEAALLQLVAFRSVPRIDAHDQIRPVVARALSVPSLRRSASQALALLGDPGGIHPLEAAIAEEKDPQVREFMRAQLKLLKSAAGPGHP